MDITEFLALPRESQRRAIKRLIYDTVPPGEVKEAAAAAGLEDYTLYKMRDENRENHDLLRPELLAILHHRRDLRLIHWVLGLFGEAAFTLPKASAPPGELVREIAQTIKDFGVYLEAQTAALAPDSPDGDKITFLEARQILAAADTAMARIAALKEATLLARGAKKSPFCFGGRGDA